MVEKIILSIIFLLGIAMFYFAKKLGKNKENLIIIFKVIGAIVTIACVIIATQI